MNLTASKREQIVLTPEESRLILNLRKLKFEARDLAEAHINSMATQDSFLKERPTLRLIASTNVFALRGGAA